MKMPSDPKTRTQVMILIGLGGLGVLLLGFFGLSHLLTYRAETLSALEASENKLSQINSTIKALPTLRKQRDDLFYAIQKASTNYILFHEYRNYHLTAREILLPMAASFDLSIDIPREGGITELPIPEAKATDKSLRGTVKNPTDYAGPISATFSLYAVTLTGRGGYLPLLAFIRSIENSNPYLTVTDISIRADEGNPEIHLFTLNVLWPIWKNLELKPKPEDLFLPVQDYANSTETP